jgi:methionyl-tRNA formyltransferase
MKTSKIGGRMKTLILTDNSAARGFANELNIIHGDIEIYQSPDGELEDIARLNIRKETAKIIANGVRCINVHPGLNPFNRGWYPQVFSILNGLPAGVTIHEIDEKLDHGPIIVQRAYTLQPWDTSGSAYAKIMELERDLLLEYFETIRKGTYESYAPQGEGNINLQKDFEQLRHIDMDQTGSYRQFINRLRALSHNEYRNAYFIEPSGKKVFIKLTLEPEDNPE